MHHRAPTTGQASPPRPVGVRGNGHTAKPISARWARHSGAADAHEVRAVRGGLTGLAMAALAVAAHGLAGGGYPDTSGLTLLALAALALGAGAGTLRSAWTLPALMTLGQPACHTVLSGSMSHEHGAGTMGFGATGFAMDGMMAAAHAAAAVACALLILIAERLYALVSQAVRVVLTRPRAQAAGGVRAPWTRSAGTPKTLLGLGAIGPRAPPVTA
ncbi:hypothetical protein [Nocardia sp. NPDC020380]|uniref:hypothetical protein n=1 Tax=Nocardia sp. NPDC020380 TaxID=3364309 RepID=UPI0037ABEAFA